MNTQQHKPLTINSPASSNGHGTYDWRTDDEQRMTALAASLHVRHMEQPRRQWDRRSER